MAVIVAITLVVLLGVAALTIDVGGLFAERRQLQNSADAAALAVAIDCAGGDCADPQATATDYAIANNAQGANVEGISPSPLSPASGEVTIDVRSGEDDGSASVVWNLFAGAIDPDNAQGIVRASATAVWGPYPMGAAPLSISMCDFMGSDEFSVEDIDDMVATLPPGEGFDPADHGDPKRILLKGTEDDEYDECTVNPGFAGAGEEKLAAGFTWLDTVDDGCELNITDYEDSGEFWVPRSGGVAEPDGVACLEDILAEGESVPIPIFTGFRPPPDPEYRLYAPAAFYITGWRLNPGGTQGTLTEPCPGTVHCIEGYFTTRLDSGEIGGGLGDLGSRAVRLSQ